MVQFYEIFKNMYLRKIIFAQTATDSDILTQLEEPRLPQINIGRDFQADLPELCNDRIDLHRAPEQLLWDPGINDVLDDTEGKEIFKTF